MHFREEPKGNVTLVRDGRQIVKRRPEFGVVAKDIPKMVFSANPVPKVGGRGSWFELRVEEFAGGEICLLAIGFTATDPETYVEAELPTRVTTIPKTYMVGYARSTYWDGERVQSDDVFKGLTPFKIFTVGALVTIDGSLEVYIDRKLALALDPTVRGLPPIDAGAPLWAVVDICGGLRKATILEKSVPPAGEEEDADKSGEN
mmetsp:Transcript_75764/g.214173  ORF Transcript_75764/g.214173 Transcript_75764/m.214173 type:complete len:203 (-) Transcript_75764:156-764(-)